MDLGLRDRVYLVTGGSRGLGFAAARALVADGARVLISAPHEATAAAAVARLTQDDAPGAAAGTVADNADPAAPGQLIAAAWDRFGRLDGALISVGGSPGGTVADTGDDAWRSAFESVFLGAVRLARALAADLGGHGQDGEPAASLTGTGGQPRDGGAKARLTGTGGQPRDGGATASLTGTGGQPRDGGAAAALAGTGGSIAFVLAASVRAPLPGLAISNGLFPGLAGVVKTLADEHGPAGIRVNGLLPVRIATDRVRQLDALLGDPDEVRARLSRSIPLRRYGEPAEFGRVAAFVLSPAASYVTGAMIAIDGGAIRAI
jgi:3-oxoacyl-[acyl-carrier protein] reductase